MSNKIKIRDFSECQTQRMREQNSRYVYPQCRKLERMRRYYSNKKIVKGMRY